MKKEDKRKKCKEWGLVNKPKWTKKEVKNALEKSYGIKSQAARYLGCSYSTINRYLKKWPDLQKVFDDCKERTKDLAETIVVNRMKFAAEKGEIIDDKGKPVVDNFGRPLIEVPDSTDLTTAQWFLKLRARDRGYVERTELAGVPDLPLGPASITIIANTAQPLPELPTLPPGDFIDVEPEPDEGVEVTLRKGKPKKKAGRKSGSLTRPAIAKLEEQKRKMNRKKKWRIKKKIKREEEE